MILSDRDILKAISEGDILIDPYDKELVQPASIDLTLSQTIRVFNSDETDYIDIRKKENISHNIRLTEDGNFILNPGELILGATKEILTLPNHLAARIEGRSSLSRIGLTVQGSASLVAPGFSGSLTLEITNVSRYPIKLYVGMRIAQVTFAQLSSPSINPYGSPNLNNKYQGQIEPTTSRIWKEFDDKS